MIDQFFKEIKASESYLKYKRLNSNLEFDEEYIAKKKIMLSVKKKENYVEYYEYKQLLSEQHEDLLASKNEIIDAVNKVVDYINEKQ